MTRAVYVLSAMLGAIAVAGLHCLHEVHRLNSGATLFLMACIALIIAFFTYQRLKALDLPVWLALLVLVPCVNLLPIGWLCVEPDPDGDPDGDFE